MPLPDVLAVVALALFGAAVLEDYVVLPGMMGLAQGTIDGMVMSGAVIFHPEWVASFDSEVYFRR